MLDSWEPVQKPAFLFATFLSALIAYCANTGQFWVPILDGANLLFHEAGHPLIGILSNRLTVYGGTIGQLVFPFVTSVYFGKRRKTTSFYLCVFWFMQNLWNIARYMADARSQVLPLVGNGEHDWTEILNRWGILNQDTQLAGSLRFFAWVGVLLVYRWYFAHRTSS
jgi:hypothetical protein